MRARAQLGWIIHGGASTRATLEALAADLRELQQKVAVLQTALDDVRRDQVRLGERQLDEFDGVRAAVGAATDDLTARVNAIDAPDAGSVVSGTTNPVERTLARWAQRDAAIGLDAELGEARAALAGRDTEIADLRERNERLAQRVAQLVIERDGMARRVTALQRPRFTGRVYRRARSTAGRLLRRVLS